MLLLFLLFTPGRLPQRGLVPTWVTGTCLKMGSQKFTVDKTLEQLETATEQINRSSACEIIAWFTRFQNGDFFSVFEFWRLDAYEETCEELFLW